MTTSRWGRNLSVGFTSLLFLFALFADFLSPNPPAMQNLNQFYLPPSRIHFFKQEQFRPKPFIYASELVNPLEVSYREVEETDYPLEFFFKGYRYSLLGLISCDRHLVGRSEGPRFYALGSDELGRDVLARVLAGTRTSLLVVLLGISIYSFLGITIGALAGFLGGWLDALLMRFSEFVLALPALYLVLGIRALLPVRIPFWETLSLTGGIIAAVAWPPLARGVRGLVLQLRGTGYVDAARALGATPIHIFRHHMLPSLSPFVLTQIVISAPLFLLGELVLSFLNVGVGDSGESWGLMLTALRDTRTLTDFWWNLMPLLMVFLTLLCLNVIGSQLRNRSPGDQIMRL